MRRLSISFLALIAAAPAFADDFYAQAPVVAATVYPNGADLTHRAALNLPAGTHRVFLPYAGVDTITALPRIRTSEGVTIGALGFRRDAHIDAEALFTPAQAEAWSAVEAARDAVNTKDDEIATARAGVKALKARLDFLGEVTPGVEASAEQLLALADMVQTETTTAQAALVAAQAGLRPLEDDLKKLNSTLAAAMGAFERLSPPDEVSDMISVEIDVAEAGPVALELTELTSDANWSMDYDLDLDRDAGKLAISRKLIVGQYTGESWNDVALTLSTARPGEESAPSPVYPDKARIEEPYVADEGFARAEAPMAMLSAPILEPEVVIRSDIKTAGVEIDGLSITYVYPTPVTIASDDAAELALDELTLDATPAIHASPRRDDTAFTVASFTNTTQEPILPGWANILRDGHLVGREQIDLIPAGAEEELGFGPIEGIRLETIFERNEEGDTGILSRSNTRAQLITFTVENLTAEAQEVRAFFPLTFSEQEDLNVRVTATPAPDETDIERRRGVSAWDLSLAPGEKREVSLQVKLDWPEGQELIWNP